MKLIITMIILFGLLPIQAFGANAHITKCEKGFIGYEYNPKLDKDCRILWKMWKRQILSNQR